ncbi:MAG: HIT family protein, partial [bacterium]
MSQLDLEISNRTNVKCAFCDIVSGDTPAHIVFEDNLSLAFLDKRPLFPGHCLLVPKKHFSTLVDLDASLITPLFLNARMLAAAVEKAMGAEGTFVAINNKVSQSVPHMHIHVVPKKKKDGLKGFFWPRNPYKEDKHIAE